MLKGNGRSRGNFLNSLLAQCAIVSGLVVFSVVAVIQVSAIRAGSDLIDESLNTRAQEVSFFLAQQLGGSIKFGNEAAIEEIVNDVVTNASPHVTNIVIYNEELTPVFSYGNGQIDSAAAAEAMETDAAVRIPAEFLAAELSRFGQDGTPAGVIVTKWTNAHLVAENAANRNFTMILAGVIFVIAQAGLVTYLWWVMSRPMSRIETSMSGVAKEDYASEIPFIKRKDEVGSIAKRLDEFRLKLKQAKAEQVEAALKSAAFQGSSAPMMMVDDAFKVTYLNQACEEVLASVQDELATHWPRTSSSTWIGEDLSMMSALQDAIAKMRDRSGSEDLVSVDVWMGHRILRVKLGAARDQSGAVVGAVVEWSDRTKSQQNAALLANLDENQIRLEFDSHGKCIAGNQNAAKVFGSVDALSLGSLLEGEQGDQTLPSDLLGSIRNAQAVRGKFNMSGPAGHIELSTDSIRNAQAVRGKFNMSGWA